MHCSWHCFLCALAASLSFGSCCVFLPSADTTSSISNSRLIWQSLMQDLYISSGTDDFVHDSWHSCLLFFIATLSIFSISSVDGMHSLKHFCISPFLVFTGSFFQSISNFCSIVSLVLASLAALTSGWASSHS